MPLVVLTWPVLRRYPSTALSPRRTSSRIHAFLSEIRCSSPAPSPRRTDSRIPVFHRQNSGRTPCITSMLRTCPGRSEHSAHLPPPEHRPDRLIRKPRRCSCWGPFGGASNAAPPVDTDNVARLIAEPRCPRRGLHTSATHTVDARTSMGGMAHASADKFFTGAVADTSQRRHAALSVDGTSLSSDTIGRTIDALVSLKNAPPERGVKFTTRCKPRVTTTTGTAQY